MSDPAILLDVAAHTASSDPRSPFAIMVKLALWVQCT
jgi:hypothetical protein